MGVGSTHLRIFWPWDTGVKAIPAGWTRDAAFTNHFLQGHNNTFTGTSDAGGAHGHTDAGHTHIANFHYHNVSGASTAALGTTVNGGMVNLAAAPTHEHSLKTSRSTKISYSTDAALIANADMMPPWVKASILQPDDIGQDIPDDAVCFGDSTTLPIGFQITNGDGDTDDLDDLFVIGTDAEANGGDTGGAATHTHAGVNHSHTATDHGHASKLCGASVSSIGVGAISGLGNDMGLRAHHDVTLVSSGSGNPDNTQVAVTAASSEPAYIKLLGIQNTSGGSLLAPGVILPFVGAYADLPSNGEWILCDGAGATQDCTDKQIKITTAVGEIGDTGGSDSHTHAVSDHTHIHSSGHTHTTTATVIKTRITATGVTVVRTRFSHTHVWTVTSTTPTIQNASVTLSTDDGRGPYRTVIWVKYAPADVTVHLQGGKLLGKTKIAAA